MALEQQTYEIAFELALEYIAEGNSLADFCRTYHSPLSAVRFRTWLMRDAKRRKAYEAARILQADAIADDLIRISDGLNPDGSASINDTNRSTLMVNTRKWVLQVLNREKYGEVKKIEQRVDQTLTTDISSMNADQLKRMLLQTAGLEAEDIEFDVDT